MVKNLILSKIILAKDLIVDIILLTEDLQLKNAVEQLLSDL